MSSATYKLDNIWTDGSNLFEVSLSPAENGLTLLSGANISLGIERAGVPDNVWSTFTVARVTPEKGIRIILRPNKRGRVSDYLSNRVNLYNLVKVRSAPSPMIEKEVDRIVFLAAGSGLGASAGTAFSLIERGVSRVRLIHTSRGGDPSRLPSVARLLQDRRVDIHIWDTKEKGRPSPKDFISSLNEISPDMIHICGPREFSDSFEESITEGGFSREKIFVDRFQGQAPVRGEDVFRGTEGAVARIMANGETKSISWPRGKSLLQSVLDSGISVPYSCKAGICSACQCRVLDGEVYVNSDLGLSEDERDMGLRLACQLFPLDGEPTIQFASSDV